MLSFPKKAEKFKYLQLKLHLGQTLKFDEVFGHENTYLLPRNQLTLRDVPEKAFTQDLES